MIDLIAWAAIGFLVTLVIGLSVNVSAQSSQQSGTACVNGTQYCENNSLDTVNTTTTTNTNTNTNTNQNTNTNTNTNSNTNVSTNTNNSTNTNSNTNVSTNSNTNVNSSTSNNTNTNNNVNTSTRHLTQRLIQPLIKMLTIPIIRLRPALIQIKTPILINRLQILTLQLTIET